MSTPFDAYLTKIAAKGAELVALHLLQAPVLDVPITTYPVAGSDQVDKVHYLPSPRRRACPERSRRGAGGEVWINAKQYFGGVPQAVWEFRVGGYQVCHKWLKDRKGRALTGDDIAHYQRVVVALQETLRLMAEIDRVIQKHGGGASSPASVQNTISPKAPE